MAETIQLKRSTTAGVVPSSLAVGELAANIPDQKLFLGNASGAPVDMLGRYLPRTGGMSTGEQVFAPSGSGSGARFSNGQVGVSHFMDAANYYLLLTASGSPLSTSYTSARPFYINLSSGQVTLGSGLAVTGGLSADRATVSGLLDASFIKAAGSLSAAQWQNQGAYFGWNYTGGGGETDLVNSRGGGGGGFNFYNTDSTSSSTLKLMMSLSGAGVLSLPLAPLPVTSGGTGATTAAGALSTLGAYAATNPSGFIAASGAPVQSVAGRAGAITLGVADVSGALSAATASATYAPINNPAFGGNTLSFGAANTGTTTAIEFGSTSTAGTTYLDWHSSGAVNDFDVRLAAFGGSSTSGQGTFDIRAGSLTLNGNAVLTATGGALPVAQGGTGATTVAAARTALGLATVASSGSYGDLANQPAIPGASSAVPLADGTGTAGTSGLFAREGHVHPTDGTRAPLNNPAFTGNNFSFGLNNAANVTDLEYGSTVAAGTTFIDWHSSGSNNDYDVRTAVFGGTAGTSGQGTYAINAAAFTWNGSAVLTAATPVTIAQGGTGATTAAGALAALGGVGNTRPAIAGGPVITPGTDFVGRRVVSGNYGVVDYFDGGSYYFLVTNSGQQTTTNYSGIRPYSINLTSGLFSVGNGLAVAGGLTTDSLTLTGAGLNVTTQGGTTSRTLAAHLSDQVSLLDFGAVGNGTTDDTAAIQAALNAVANGVNVLAPPLTYKVTGTLTLGNGSSSAASTRWGITLRGPSPAPYPAEMFAGFPNTGVAKFVWAGASGGTMFKLAGPLNSWGLSNLYLDGASLAGVGIDVVSASNGDSRGLTLTNFTNAAIRENVLASYTGFGLANSMHNSYDNVAFYLPNVQGAKAVVQTGVPNASPQGANSCFAKFSNVTINAPGGTNATFGFYLQWTDTNYYQDIHYFGGNANSACFFFDYTLTTTTNGTTKLWDNLPSANTIIGIDPSGNGIDSGAFVNAGTPGLGSRPNYVKGVGQINLAKIPNVLNIITDLPHQVQRVDAVGLTQPITNSQVFIPYETGLYRTSFYLRLSNAGATGTLTARITTNDGVGPVNLDLNPSVNATGGATFGTITYRAIGGSPVNYSIVFQNTSTAPTYNMSMSTERIG